MRRMTKTLRWINHRFPRVVVPVRKHPRWTGGVAVVVVGGLVGVGIWLSSILGCGPGMSKESGACIGVDLASTRFTSAEPPKMRALEAAVKANNDTVSQNYVSVVLLQNMSPDARVDTRNYSDLYPDIEGALAGVWRANHTAAVQGSLPQVKLFLANMGSQYANWSQAADEIAKNAAANHIVSVIGLGQSTDNTRAAAAQVVSQAHLPVIGATVTGDSMNFGLDGRLNTGFFRTAPTNTDTVLAAARYVASIEPDPARVAIVQDNALGDDYTQTLGSAADRDMPMAHRFPFTSPTNLPPGVDRRQQLINQFSSLDQNICSVAPAVVYFAGRGSDVGPFVQTWTQGGTPCANGNLTVVTGNDGGAAINDPNLQQAVRGGHVRVVFTSQASSDEWGPCNGSNEQAAYDTFQTVFTGQPGVCTGQRVQADDGTAPLAFDPADLRTGEGMLTHDAMVVAVTAARRAAGGAADTVIRVPLSQVGFIEEMRCTNAVLGSSGLIEYGPDQAQYGNPVDKPVPIVEIHADGSTATVSNKPSTQRNATASC